MFKKIRRYIKDPYHSIGYEMFKRCPRLMSDKYYLSILWEWEMGYTIDWRHPRTYNEKLQWLKLYDRKPQYTQMVDKYRVKQWVADRIGEKYIIPTLAVYHSVDEIDLSQLPDQFVLKCNHDSGSVVICEDKSKFDLDAAKKLLSNALNENFYWRAREWPYKNVKPCIFAEQYIKEISIREEVLKKNKLQSVSDIKIVPVDFNHFKWNNSRVYGDVWGLIETKMNDVIGGSDGLSKEGSLKGLLDFCGKLCEKEVQIRGEFYLIDNRLYFGDLILDEDNEYLSQYAGLQKNEYTIIRNNQVPNNVEGVIVYKDGFMLYLHDDSHEHFFAGLKDYKFFCFSGVPKVMYIANRSSAFPTANFYDMDYNPLPLHTRYPPAFVHPEKPRCFEEMKVLAAKLSEGIPQVRVDFYESGDQLLFGEMTFFHGGGFSEVHPKEWNMKMGDWITLPTQRRGLI